MVHLRRASLAMMMLWTSIGLAQSESPTTQNSAASVSDVAALVSAGQYSDALRAINRLLPTAQGNSSGQDRYRLLMLRAESQLHLKSHDAAIVTLDEIAKGCEQASDPQGQSEAIALETLIQRSSNSLYTPRILGDKTPLNILAPDSRKAAYLALLSDETAALHAQQDTARTTKSLSPLPGIAQQFVRVEAIERMVIGSPTKTSALAKDLSKWATAQIEQALDDEDAQITQIAAEIGRRSGSGSRGGSVKRGLDQQQEDTLNNISSECQKIPPMVLQLNKAFGQSDVLSTSLRAQAIADRANIILQGGYAPPVKKPSRSTR
jgi:hypothetical protein